jgi:hypothetical protein
MVGTRVRASVTLVAGVSIMAAGLFPGVLTGAASAADVGNAGVFELDGNTVQNAPTPPPYDWQCVFNNPTGQTGCPPSAAPADTTTTPTLLGKVFQTDYVTPDPTYFSSNGAGVKDVNDISTWGCTTLNNPLSKDDILNAYGSVFIAQGNSPKAGHVLLYLAQERGSNNGDSFAGFWLMHSQHACSGSGSFSNPQHDPGDLLVVSNYTNGGSTSTIQLYSWDTSVTNNLKLLASGFTCGAGSPPPGLVHPDDICGIASGTAFTPPWAPNQSLQPNQFVEAGIDLTDLVDQGIFPVSTQPNASCFNDFLSETRSSQQTTATLKDYTSGRFTFCVAPHVTTQQTSGSTTSAAMVIEKGAQVTDQATLSAPLSGTPAGTMTYNLYPASANCTGTPTFTSTKTLSGGVAPPSDPTPTTLVVGSYEWQAVYSGDVTLGGHNFPSMSTCGDEPLTVVDASIGIVRSAVNQIGTAHTFTITVNAYVPSGTSVVFNSITPSVSPTPSSQSTTCGAPSVSGTTATCTLTINSTTVTTYTANASAVLTLGGLTVHRSTDGSSGPAGPGGTGAATKAYVNATIAIGPPLAVNVVGAPHTFTVTVTADPGTTGTPSFSAVTYSVLDSANNPPSSLTSTCAHPTVSGNTATCTITINNSTTDSFTAIATDTVTMGGLPVTVTTNGLDGNSPPAVKTYGNGIISISPNGVNEVGTPHTFTVVVVGIPGTTTDFAPITYSVQDAAHNAPGSVTSTCASPTITRNSTTGDSATCTITINNSTPDVFTATASDAVTVNGFTVTLSTNGTNGNSGPATKTYVDAKIAIAPSAVNEVGQQHVFTVTVTGLGASEPFAVQSITTSVVDSHGNPPGTMSTTCGSPNVSGNVATCTITIDNSTADVFTASATAHVTVDGLALTRSTDGTHGSSGPATKTYVDANITIAPSAVNEVGQQHVFTVTVTGLQSNQPFSVQSITTSVVDSHGNPPDTMSTTCGNPSVSGNVATCTITIDNSTADVFTASATAHVTVDGLALTRSTDGTHGSSGPATKTYVDGSIAITPQTKDNEVGNPHVFTITVTALPAGQTIVFNSITPTLSVNPSSVTPTQNVSTCGSPTINGNVATCTVTINSASAATYTLDAAAVMTIDGLEIARSTTGNSGPGGTGSATKNYVDASVGIGLTAVNPIGQQHVFTIVVNAYPAGATPVVFNSITPSVSPQPLDMSTTCGNPTVSDTPTGEQATCTLTINNDLPATFIANVSASVSMGTVTVTRSTATNPGPGGTGPATKTYVTANIGLSPLTATDPVGDLHTLTATVTTNNGSGDSHQPAPAPDGTVVSFTIVSGPGTLASPSCTISNGLGTCTDVLTSNVAGTTVVNATTTVTVLTVSLTRSTNDSVPGDSVNAVKNWVKVQPTITTVQSAGGTVGTSVHDTATVSGGSSPTGTVTFQLFGPNDTTCSGTPVFTSSDDALTNGAAASGSFTPTTTGTYEWVATYNGDAGNLTAVSKCGDEPVTIAASGVLGIAIPNTGAGLMTALAEGLGLALAGTGIAALARRRRRNTGN